MDDLLELRQSELRRHVTSTLNLKRVPSLKRMCRSRGMRVGGRKGDLIDRLVADVLEKGWTVSRETDLWKDYSMVPESPADSSKRSKAARSDQASVSNLDDSDSGRSSPPSSSASSSPSSSSLTTIPDDSSLDSVSGETGAADRSPRDIFAFDDPPGDGISDSGPGSRRKRVALFVDTESPNMKRKKNLSGQSVDSGIEAPSRRPHLTRRALKANLRKTSSRRSGTDLLSRSNIGVVFNTIKGYAMREANGTEEPVVANAESSRSRRRGKNEGRPDNDDDGMEAGATPRLSVSDVVPISIISCDSLRNGEEPTPTFAFPSPLRNARTKNREEDGESSSSTNVVAALTSPTGVPVAIVTALPSPLGSSDTDEDVVDDDALVRDPPRPVPASRVTPMIEWIRLTDGPASDNSEGSLGNRVAEDDVAKRAPKR